MPDSAKAPVALIRLHGIEVPDSPEASAHSWEDANAVLATWGETAPPAGQGYHKVHFHILFANGTEYEGRFDLQRGGRESDGATLQVHVHAFALCHAGRRRPPHVRPEAYQHLLEQIGQAHREFYARVLDTCDLGPEPPPPLVEAPPSLTREAGIRYPVFLTRAVWERYVQVPAGVIAQDETGRLWDIVWMYRCHAQRVQGSVLTFSLLVRNDNLRPHRVQLQAVCEPGDTPEPVITIRCPEER
jgi:hypothetical protein